MRQQRPPNIVLLHANRKADIESRVRVAISMSPHPVDHLLEDSLLSVRRGGASELWVMRVGSQALTRLWLLQRIEREHYRVARAEMLRDTVARQFFFQKVE